MEYQPLRQHLEEGCPVLVDPAMAPLLPEDPDWPTPIDPSSVHTLVARLPHRAAVLCAVTAAEMVLSIWEERYPGDARPRNGIRSTWHSLRVAPRFKMEAAATYSERLALGWPTSEAYAPISAADAVAAHDPVWAATAAGFATEAAVAYDPKIAAATDFAYSATSHIVRQRSTTARLRFYRLWWSACRRRLAIRDVPAAEITWYT